MKFARIVLVTLSPRPQTLRPFLATLGKVTLRSESVNSTETKSDELKQLVVAESPLTSLLEFDADRAITANFPERRSCEEAIETMVNSIAIACHTGRMISSASPPAAFIAESDDDGFLLSTCSGVKFQHSTQVAPHYEVPLDAGILQALEDRHLGVALLSEALTHKTAMGKFRDLVRLFELAFAMPVNELCKKLHRFLSNTDRFSRSEIESWLALRDGASHADRKKAKTVVLEADVRSVIPRMEQAAIDLLYNKAIWHDRSDARRTLVKFPARSTSPTGDIAMIAGTPVRMHFQTLDEFGAYPSDLQGKLKQWDKEWWWKPWKDDAAQEKGVLLMSGKLTIERPPSQVQNT